MEKEKEKLSITEQLEEIKNAVCNDLCIYSHSPVPTGRTEDWLFNDDDSPCMTCPLNRM